MSRKAKHRYQKHREWTWPLRLAVGAGAVVVVAGVGVVLTLFFGRPSVSVASTGPAMFDVHVSGWGSKLVAGQATSQGRAITLVHSAGGLVPADQMGQGQVVRVTATATSPSWLHWLLGGPVSTTKTLRTPAAVPAEPVTLAPRSGVVPVSFDHPVSVVQYQAVGGSTHLLRLSRPSTVADIPVSSQVSGGLLQVSAAPRPWESIAPSPSTVTWFAAPIARGPAALASPDPGSATAAPNAPISFTFAQSVASLMGSSRPTVSPAVPGTWSEPSANTLVFTPSGFGFGPSANVTVTFQRPVSVVGETSEDALTTASTTYHFSTGPGSMLRLQQILAQLGYLPLQFTPAAGVVEPTTFAGEVATMSQPLAGSFSWRWATTPATLMDQWSVGTDNLLVKGALMTFLSDQSSSFDGFEVDPETVAEIADASTWQALLQAAAANQNDPNPYSYVYVSQSLPETLTLWQNGSVVLTTPANTGISSRPTANGTFPIYVRYAFNYMSGTNPDGSHYDDPVYWINYFNGGDAVHGFVRGSYGWPQSLGCVELPVSTAQVVFSHLAVGDLVTVAA